MLNLNHNASISLKKSGFTLTELLIGSSIMTIIILGALSLYVRSNKISVDHQQFAGVQHNVRSSIFFIARDVKSAGVGLSDKVAGYFIEGTDALGPSPESTDSIKVMGNFEEPLSLAISQYSGGQGGGSATVFLYSGELQNSPYDCPGFYENRVVMIISTTCAGCFAIRYISQNSVQGCTGGAEHIIFQPGQSQLNPPGGLIDTGCGETCWDDGIITIGQIRQFWLDTTGNPGDYPSLNLTVGQYGYLGIPHTLYLTTIDNAGGIVHMPLAQNVENLQFQYNGDLDDDGVLDGYTDWDNTNWTINPTDDQATKQSKLDLISRIRLVKIWVLGRTAKPFISVSGSPSSNLHLYRRPSIANTLQASQDDKHRRFLLESTVIIRNLSLNLYNLGTR